MIKDLHVYITAEKGSEWHHLLNLSTYFGIKSEFTQNVAKNPSTYCALLGKDGNRIFTVKKQNQL